MKESVFEFLDRINAIEDEEQRAHALGQAAQNQRVFDVLYYGISPNVTFRLPPGNPPYKAAEDVTTHGFFWGEVRRMYLFVEGGPNLNDAKMQTQFIMVLEFIHPKDAEIVLLMKDRKWPYDNISAEFVEKVFPGLLNMKVLPNGNRIHG